MKNCDIPDYLCYHIIYIIYIYDSTWEKGPIALFIPLCRALHEKYFDTMYISRRCGVEWQSNQFETFQEICNEIFYSILKKWWRTAEQQ